MPLDKSNLKSLLLLEHFNENLSNEIWDLPKEVLYETAKTTKLNDEVHYTDLNSS